MRKFVPGIKLFVPTSFCRRATLTGTTLKQSVINIWWHWLSLHRSTEYYQCHLQGSRHLPWQSSSSLLVWGASRWPQPPRFSQKYCDTNGRRIAIQMGGVLTVFPFPQRVGAPEVLRYKWEAYCNTNRRCIAILFCQVVVVGVSDILLIVIYLKKTTGWQARNNRRCSWTV